jgi:hypothetical protein
MILFMEALLEVTMDPKSERRGQVPMDIKYFPGERPVENRANTQLGQNSFSVRSPINLVGPTRLMPAKRLDVDRPSVREMHLPTRRPIVAKPE